MQTYTFLPMCLTYEAGAGTVEQFTGPSPRPPEAWELKGFDLATEAAKPDGPIAALVSERAPRR